MAQKAVEERVRQRLESLKAKEEAVEEQLRELRAWEANLLYPSSTTETSSARGPPGSTHDSQKAIQEVGQKACRNGRHCLAIPRNGRRWPDPCRRVMLRQDHLPPAMPGGR